MGLVIYRGISCQIVGITPNLFRKLPYPWQDSHAYLCNSISILQGKMQVNQENANPQISQDILIIADCIHGAEKAASFASRNLHLDDSKMVLLQTFQKQAYGQSTLRNITPLLEKTARRELSELKNRIVRNNGVNPKSISKVVVEGKLLSVLKQRFGNMPDTAVVLGFDQGMLKPNTYCRKLIVSVLKSGIRPLYIIGNGITLISKDRVTFFSGEKKFQDGAYYQFLNSIFIGLGLKQSIMVTSADSLLKPDNNQVDYLDFNSWKLKDEYPVAEKLFRSLKEGRDDIAIQTIKLS